MVPSRRSVSTLLARAFESYGSIVRRLVGEETSDGWWDDVP
jgi:hypothetical protein